ncbi:MAG TPA: histidine kinase [Terracidiphilus sp.]|nr:histidine kinase [Terracidiphilus sp.]
MIRRCSKLGLAVVAIAAALSPTFLSSERAPEAHGPARLQSIESAIQAASFSSTSIPVVVRGIVTSNRHRIIIEDRTGAVEVKPIQALQISLGDEVEVIGKMTVVPDPEIQQAEMRRLWGGAMPLPLSITPDQAADGENELFLVQTVAELVNFTPAGLTGVRLNLRGGHQNFFAILPSDIPDGELSTKSLQPGATLRLTGILVVNHGLDTASGDAFGLQLRAADDIELVEPPSWWTGPHLLIVGALAVILVLVGISTYIHVRHARYRAIAEERASIARDLHDTLAQGYAGITLQLEAAQQVIERDPERAEELLGEALQLVRHSRDESHLSIDILRSLSRSDPLDVLIARCIQQFRVASNVSIEQKVTGDPAALSYGTVNNLFRIVQEAVANAVHHAKARKIMVRVSYRKNGVLIEVEDDGSGFDPGRVPGPEQGHFGIVGMRERCAALSAKFDIESAAKGTLVRVGTEL